MDDLLDRTQGETTPSCSPSEMMVAQVHVNVATSTVHTSRHATRMFDAIQSATLGIESWLCASACEAYVLDATPRLRPRDALAAIPRALESIAPRRLRLHCALAFGQRRHRRSITRERPWENTNGRLLHNSPKTQMYCTSIARCMLQCICQRFLARLYAARFVHPSFPMLVHRCVAQ